MKQSQNIKFSPSTGCLYPKEFTYHFLPDDLISVKDEAHLKELRSRFKPEYQHISVESNTAQAQAAAQGQDQADEREALDELLKEKFGDELRKRIHAKKAARDTAKNKP